jgi:hypothetical protein
VGAHPRAWTGAARVGVMVKVHHAATDGLGAAELFALLHVPTPDERAVPGASTSRQRVRACWRAGCSDCRASRRGWRAPSRALPSLDQVPFLRSLPGVTPTAFARVTTPEVVGIEHIPCNRGAFLCAATAAKFARSWRDLHWLNRRIRVPAWRQRRFRPMG